MIKELDHTMSYKDVIKAKQSENKTDINYSVFCGILTGLFIVGLICIF